MVSCFGSYTFGVKMIGTDSLTVLTLTRRGHTLGVGSLQEALRWNEPGGILQPSGAGRGKACHKQKVAGRLDGIDEKLLGVSRFIQGCFFYF